MPYVIKYNRPKIEKKIEAISRYVNLQKPGFESFMGWVLELRDKLNIPHTLKDLIKEDSRFEEMSLMALNDPSTAGNPVKLKQDDFLQLYKDCFNGDL